MTIVVYTNPNAPHQIKFHGAMAAGIESHGTEVIHKITGQWVNSDVAVVWGERNRLRASKYATRVLVMEIGYLPQDRSAEGLQFVSCGWNGLNGRADFCNANSPSDRWQKHGHELPEWNAQGDYILLLGQVPGDQSHAHADINSFYVEAIRGLAGIGLPVVFRPHPLGSKAPAGCVLDTSESLEQALNGAAFAVTFNSNSGVDAVLNGTPVITMDKGSMAWDVSGHEFALPPTPAREQWCYDLAYAQWSESEIREGDTWQHLRKGLQG